VGKTKETGQVGSLDRKKGGETFDLEVIEGTYHLGKDRNGKRPDK